MFSGTIVSQYIGWGGDQANGAPVGIENIRDGTSNTALFSERLMGLAGNPTVLRSSIDFKRAVFDAPVPTVSAVQKTGSAGALAFIQACQSMPGTTPSHASWGSGAYWLAGYPLHVIINDYLHAGPPNGPACNNTKGTFASLSWVYFVNPHGSAPPTSNHPGGVNVAFGDGSVKFIKDSIGMQPWWALGTRNGGETISSDQY